MLLKSIKLFIIIGAATALYACSEGPYAKHSDADLQDAYSDCEQSNSMSPGSAITCDNVRTECDKRAKKRGHKICF